MVFACCWWKYTLLLIFFHYLAYYHGAFPEVHGELVNISLPILTVWGFSWVHGDSLALSSETN